MLVTVLGTASADGWPNPFCRCASCTWARRSGTLRAQTSALVDGVLLCDAGPDTARQATAAGTDLADVAALLIGHGHDDHVHPPLLLWRAWAHRRDPLLVAGPTGALDRLREWCGPDDPVRWLPVEPGARFDVDTLQGRYRVTAAAAGHRTPGHPDGADPWAEEALLYLVTGPDGARLLYGTDTGPLPSATIETLRGTAADLVLLEETFGDHDGHGTGHLDLTTFPRALADLRAAGAIDGRAAVVAVHLSHHNPPGPELDRRLGAWGATTVPDGARLDVAPGEGAAAVAPAAPTAPRRVLLVGGARSGKSREAERLLAHRDDVVYVATGLAAADDEWAARVEHHRARRPGSWVTRETRDVVGVLQEAPAGSAVLVDCLTLWLTGLLDEARAWDGDPAAAGRAGDAVRAASDGLVAALRSTAASDVVLVSNEVGTGVVPETASGRLFRDLMGRVNAAVADACDVVALVVAGRVLPLAGDGEGWPA